MRNSQVNIYVAKVVTATSGDGFLVSVFRKISIYL